MSRCSGPVQVILSGILTGFHHVQANARPSSLCCPSREDRVVEVDVGAQHLSAWCSHRHVSKPCWPREVKVAET